MKAIFYFALVFGLSLTAVRAEGPVDTAANVAHDAVDTAKNVGHKVVRGTKRVVHRVADAVTPESDARRVDVTVSDDRIDMPSSIQPGKTAFVVHNAGNKTHNFEVDGDAGDYEFEHQLRPGQTKVLHVRVTKGPCTIRSLGSQPHKERSMTLTVR
jgi:hypothetical protein